MQPEEWDSGFGKSVGMYLNGEGIRGRDARGERVTDVAFLTYFNAHDGVVTFTLPPEEYSPGWTVRIDTAEPGARDEVLEAGDALDVPARSMIVLRAEPEHEIQRTPVDTTTHTAADPSSDAAEQSDPDHPAATPANPAASATPSAAGTPGASGVPSTTGTPNTTSPASTTGPDSATATTGTTAPETSDPGTPDSDTPGSAA